MLADVLTTLEVPHATIDCVACTTPRAVYETCLNQLHGHRPSAANGYASLYTCEHPAMFVDGLQRLASSKGRVVLVLERAERLRHNEKLLVTLLSLPSLCLLGSPGRTGHQVLPIFVAEALWPDFYRLTEFRPVMCVGFGGYDKTQLTAILRRDARSIVAAASRPDGRGGDARSASADGTDGHAGGMTAFEAFLPLFVDFFSEARRGRRPAPSSAPSNGPGLAPNLRR